MYENNDNRNGVADFWNVRCAGIDERFGYIQFNVKVQLVLQKFVNLLELHHISLSVSTTTGQSVALSCYSIFTLDLR